jgi:hypothetical protein
MKEKKNEKQIGKIVVVDWIDNLSICIQGRVFRTTKVLEQISATE